MFEKSSAVVGVKGMQKIEDGIVEQDRFKYNVIKLIQVNYSQCKCNYESSMQRRLRYRESARYSRNSRSENNSEVCSPG